MSTSLCTVKDTSTRSTWPEASTATMPRSGTGTTSVRGRTAKPAPTASRATTAATVVRAHAGHQPAGAAHRKPLSCRNHDGTGITTSTTEVYRGDYGKATHLSR